MDISRVDLGSEKIENAQQVRVKPISAKLILVVLKLPELLLVAGRQLLWLVNSVNLVS